MRIASKPLALSLAIAAISVPVQAEQLTLEEVVVTAQKRAESLQDVPISVVALSGETIDKAGITTLEGMSAIMPNVTITQEQITDRVSIRGIASGGNQGFDQSVGLFSNGVYLARGFQFRSAFLDVGSVEVLRGPQATLFGKNTIAGAANITSRKPTEELEGEIYGGYETEYDSNYIGGSLSGALTDTLNARLAFKTSDEKGWVEDVARNEDGPSSESTNYRLSLAWAPTEDLSFNFSHEEFDLEGDSKGFEVIHDEIINPDGSVAGPQCRFPGAPVGGVALGGDCSLNQQSAETNVDGSPGFTEEELTEVNTRLTALTTEYVMDELTLTLVTGYSESILDELNPGMHQPFPTNNTVSFEEFEQFSQEIRITSPGGETIDWLAGLYYETNDLSFEDNIHLHATNILQGAVPNNVKIRTDFEQESETYAAFAQATWNINEAMRLTLGLRYGDEEKEARQNYRLLDAGTDRRTATTFAGIFTEDPSLNPLGAGEDPVAGGEAVAAGLSAGFNFDEHDTGKQKRQQENWSPSINFQYDVTSDVMTYASASRGYKSGGFDARLARSTDSFEFDEEQATTFELGTKSRLFDDRAELNAAIFYTEYEDLQFSSFNGGLSFYVDNAANAELKGFEFDGRLLVTENLILSGGGAYLDFEFKDFENGPCDIYTQTAANTAAGTSSASCTKNLSGERATNTPEWTFNLAAEWTQPLGDALEFVAGATVVYEDEYYTSADLDPVMLQDAVTKVDLRLGLNDIANNAWSVALLVKNVTDEDTFHYGTDVPLVGGARFVRPDAPRTATIQAVYRF